MCASPEFKRIFALLSYVVLSFSPLVADVCSLCPYCKERHSPSAPESENSMMPSFAERQEERGKRGRSSMFLLQQ